MFRHTIHRLPSKVHRLSSDVCRLSSVVCRLSSVVCRLPSIVCVLVHADFTGIGRIDCLWFKYVHSNSFQSR